MKLINLIRLFIIAVLFLKTTPVFSSDLNADFINNAVFDDRAFAKQKAKTVSLFHGEDKIFGKKKNKKKVNVQKFDSENVNIKDANLTDVEYVKKLKKTENKKIKNQFQLNVNKADTSEKQEVNENTEADYSNESDSIVTVEPRNKKFFKRNKNKDKKNDKKNQQTQTAQSDVILTADVTDYFPDRNEIEAVGNAKLQMTGENFVLYADKIIFNHDINSVRAYQNVKIVQEENVTTGDFINIDLNTAHGWIQKPLTSNYSVKVRAEEAYVYPDRIEEYEGVANILEDKRFSFGSSNFTNLVNPGQLDFGDFYSSKAEPSSVKIKAKDIIVDSKDGHNIINLKQAGVYYKKFKIGVLPALKIVTDKENAAMETNIPEFGSDANLGMYAGPSFVIGLPKSTVLKVAPVVVYSKNEGKFGIGGIGKFASETNETEFAYGSPENKFLLRGYQKFTDNLRLNYSQNMYISEWFLGYRRPMYAVGLEYDDKYYIKDLGATFRHKLQAGYYSDFGQLGSFAKGRLRWMTQMQKTLFSYTNPENTFNTDIGLVAQTSIAQYTTGDTFGIVRVGPMINTSYKRWTQSLLYYQSGVGGKTPFRFDDYYYGKSNIHIIESLRLHKYVTIGYLMSIAIAGRDSYTTQRLTPYTVNNPRNWLQENMFLISIGPEEARVTFGYDAYRQTTAMYFSMLLGTKDMDIAFKKTVINNPDNMTKTNPEETKVSKYLKQLRYKVFPATDPDYEIKKKKEQEEMYKKMLNVNKEEAEEDAEYKEIQQQVIQQVKPFLNEQELIKNNRM